MMTDEEITNGAPEEEAAEDWVSMTEASQQTGVPYQTISRLANKGRLEARKSPYDDRIRLVRLSQVQKIAKWKR